jgi:hypothetical protein
MLIVKFNAQIQMCVELVAQFVSHEIENAKCAFILHRTKHLGNNIFRQFNKFQELMIKDGRGKIIAPNHSDQIELIVFAQNCFRLMQHGHLLKKCLAKYHHIQYNNLGIFCCNFFYFRKKSLANNNETIFLKMVLRHLCLLTIDLRVP